MWYSGSVRLQFNDSAPFGLLPGSSLPEPRRLDVVFGSLVLVSLGNLSAEFSGVLALLVVHVQRVSNVLADGLSLFISLSMEWTVDADSFN